LVDHVEPVPSAGKDETVAREDHALHGPTRQDRVHAGRVAGGLDADETAMPERQPGGPAGVEGHVACGVVGVVRQDRQRVEAHGPVPGRRGAAQETAFRAQNDVAVRGKGVHVVAVVFSLPGIEQSGRVRRVRRVAVEAPVVPEVAPALGTDDAPDRSVWRRQFRPSSAGLSAKPSAMIEGVHVTIPASDGHPSRRVAGSKARPPGPQSDESTAPGIDPERASGGLRKVVDVDERGATDTRNVADGRREQVQ
jgi:hypothetical protein